MAVHVRYCGSLGWFVVDNERYLRKDGHWHTTCGDEGFWDTECEARLFFEKVSNTPLKVECLSGWFKKLDRSQNVN